MDKNAYKGKAGGTQNEGCPTAKVQQLTNVKSTITTAINAMVANGNTNIPEGLAWGWRLISPGTPFTTGVAYEDKTTIKAIILLTDGENSVDNTYSSYGQGDGGNPHIGPVVDAGLDTKLTALCQNIKANQDGIDDGDDIVLYTIAFAVSGPILTRLSNCATNASRAFTADTVSGLANHIRGDRGGPEPTSPRELTAQPGSPPAEADRFGCVRPAPERRAAESAL